MTLPRVVLPSSFPCRCDGHGSCRHSGSQVPSLPLVCTFHINGLIQLCKPLSRFPKIQLRFLCFGGFPIPG